MNKKKSDPMKTSGFTKVVYTSGASPMKEDKAVIKDYTFEWDGMFSIRQLVFIFVCEYGRRTDEIPRFFVCLVRQRREW